MPSGIISSKVPKLNPVPKKSKAHLAEPTKKSKYLNTARMPRFAVRLTISRTFLCKEESVREISSAAKVKPETKPP